MKPIYLTIICSALLSISSKKDTTTPGETFFQQRIMLLAANTQSIFYLKTTKTGGDTYYEYTDSVFIEQKNISTNEVAESKLIRVVHSEDTTALGEWKHTDLLKSEIDILEYLKENNAQHVYPGEHYNLQFYFIGAKGIIFDRSMDSAGNNPSFEVLMSMHRLKELIPDLKKRHEEYYGARLEEDLKVFSYFHVPYSQRKRCEILKIGTLEPHYEDLIIICE